MLAKISGKESFVRMLGFPATSSKARLRKSFVFCVLKVLHSFLKTDIGKYICIFINIYTYIYIYTYLIYYTLTSCWNNGKKEIGPSVPIV